MLEKGLDEQLELWKRRQRRYLIQVLVSVLFLFVVIWFFWGYRDVLEYSFSSQTEPLVIGNVINGQPSDLKPNSYVSLQGITEHRGLTQKMVRGLSVNREELWYFRLLGSNGVFIEVPADSSRYGLATLVNVRGRVVDPLESPKYKPLMALYRDLFFPEERRAVRIIQVGVVPGEGQLPFILVALFLCGLTVANIISIIRLVRERRMGPSEKLVRG